MLHKTYLPFSEETLKTHFLKSSRDASNLIKHVNRFKSSIFNYKHFEENLQIDKSVRTIRQIEKDETFWTASSLMTIFHSENRNSELICLLQKAYGEKPPLDKFASWEECLCGELNLFFETNIPSSIEYRKWLEENVHTRNFIPYIIEKINNKKDKRRIIFEGPTNVDALLINSSNGFAVFIEAKVLSDISYQVSFDCMRNQIIRNIDVMLSGNDKQKLPLNKREPDNSLFLMLTPKIFKENPRSRFYGYTYWSYKNDPQLIAADLTHRNLKLSDCVKIAKRIGWISWEDLKETNKDCCKWIK